MKYQELVEFIINNIGTENNVISVQHCATRLRFTLKDDKKVKKQELEKNKEILQVVEAGGQIQLVIGTQVADVYETFCEMTNIKKDGDPTKSEGRFLDKVFHLFSGIFTPFVPVLAGAGILRGILTLVTSAGWLATDTGTYTILYAAADTLLYFLPFYLAISASRYFKVNEFIGLSIAGSMLYPTILTAFTNGTSLEFLGIHVVLIKYASSVVPIIIAVYVLSKVDKILRRYVPTVVKSFVVPLLDLLIMVPLTLLAIGPVFTFLTNVFTDGFLTLYGFNPIIFGFLFGICWHPLVIFGLHRGFIPVNLNNLATTGREPLLAITMPSNFAQTGASLGVAFKSKNKDFKAVAAANVIPGLFGITEPIVYGVTLKAKKTFYYSCFMAGIGGAIIAGAGCYAIGLPAGGILATPVFAEHALAWYIGACVLAFVGAFLLTFLFGFDETVEPSVTKQDNEKRARTEDLVSPVEGKSISLQEVQDDTFKSLALGDGIAIQPTNGELCAPCDGEIIAVFPTKHAIAMRSDKGAELLLHVGIDTVKMGGEGFNAFVSEKSQVKKGQTLLTFDIKEIEHQGYDPVVMMILTNTKDYTALDATIKDHICCNETILSLVD